MIRASAVGERVRRGGAWRLGGLGWGWAVLLFVLGTTSLEAQTLDGEIDFEGIPAGTILSTVNGNASGVPVGPILVNGVLPSHPALNRAVVFDSSNPTGGDPDLGSPNETFGGPGIGVAGEAGQPWQNDYALGKVLIVAENLYDTDGDGLVDDPDDATQMGMLLEFDFTTITQPFIPENVTLYSLTVIDGEGTEVPGSARLYDATDTLIASVSLLATGDNGVRTHELGTGGAGISGVARLEVILNGSSAIDDIAFEVSAPTPPPVCSIDASSPVTIEVGQTVTFDVTAEATFPGGTVVLEVDSLPPGATMTPSLPLDSAPASFVTSTFSWTPTLADLGTTSLMFSVLDSEDGVSDCFIDIDVICESEILAQPQGQTVCEGDLVQFSVTATGTEPITYQWQFDGIRIPGATASFFELAAATPSDAGDYTVLVTNPCGETLSEVATLVVQEAPEVTDPSGATLCEGDPLSLSVVGTGTPPLSYQWSLDGAEIPGATGSTYDVASVGLSDAGSYTVTVTNACGAATSAAAVVVVQEGPEITASPMSQSVCVGAVVSFTVSATGAAPLTYQWFLDGAPIPGATSASYSIPSAQLGDAGVYTVTVTNACGDATSGGATLTVLSSPSIDVQPMGDDVCAGDPFALSVTASGAAPLSYQWFLGGSPIAGATASTYSVAAAGPSDAGSYTVSVTNDCGSLTSAAAVIVLRDAPAITMDPMSQSACDGDQVTFTVTATGSAPLSYQWTLDGADIVGATGSSYTIASVAGGNAGLYAVVVSNDCGQATSSGATLTVASGPAIDVEPMGADICSGDPLELSVVASGDGPLTYQWFRDGAMIPGATGATYSVPSASTADAGNYFVIVTNDCGSATSSTVSVVVSTGPSISASPMSQSGCAGDDVTLSVTATGSPVLTYQWRLDGVDIAGATGSSYMLVLSGATAGTYDVVVSNGCGTIDSGDAVITVANPATVGAVTGDLQVCEGAPATLMATGSGTAPLSYQWYRNGSVIPGATSSSFSIASASAGDAGDYTVMVSNDCGDALSDPATLVVDAAPEVTSDPAGGEVCPGESLMLTVTADGSGVLTYQWRLDGIDIPGATSASYTVTDFDAADAGNYSVVVTNDCGSDTSGVALVVEGDDCGGMMFTRGDCNTDGVVNMADAIKIMRFLFQGFPGSACIDACDFNDDGIIDIGDVIFLLNYIFLDGPEPFGPFPNCGEDETEDGLGCTFYECPPI